MLPEVYTLHARMMKDVARKLACCMQSRLRPSGRSFPEQRLVIEPNFSKHLRGNVHKNQTKSKFKFAILLHVALLSKITNAMSVFFLKYVCISERKNDF